MSKLGLYGRQEESDIIRNNLNDLVKTGNNKLLYISGVSGTGKTALATSILDAVNTENGIFAIGKFDQKLRDEVSCDVLYPLKIWMIVVLTK